MNRPEVFTSYETDFFAWTQAQADALRGLPARRAGDRVDIANLDLEHVAEEIEDLGKRELRKLKSLLSRTFEHLIEIAVAPTEPAAPHWRREALVFQRDAFNGFSPGMRQYLDIADLWRQGRRFAAAALNRDESTLAVPLDCPFSLDDLVADAFDIDGAIAQLT